MSDIFVQDHNPAANRVIMLLHGLGTTSASWQVQVPALTAVGFRVLVPDLPGFGRTGYRGRSDGRRWSMADFAATARQVLESRGVARAHVAGISMGGTVALQLALDAPALVDRLILVSTFPSLQATRPSGWLALWVRIALLYSLGLPSQARMISKRVFPHPDQEALRQAIYDQILQADPKAYRAAVWALQRFNVTARLGEIRAPTLILTGDQDTTVSPDNQCLLLAIPGSRQVVVPGVGHGVIVDHPDQANATLVSFLQEGGG
jgi:pimeloyl-ACP methyl ester carboxylesterase